MPRVALPISAFASRTGVVIDIHQHITQQPISESALRRADSISFAQVLYTRLRWSCLDRVREGPFHRTEVEETADEHDNRNGNRDRHVEVWAGLRSQQRPAESVHHARHRVERIDQSAISRR